MRSRAISSSSRISTERPASREICTARSAKTDGVRTFDGSLQRSRAMFDDSPRTRPRSTASSSASEGGGFSSHLQQRRRRAARAAGRRGPGSCSDPVERGENQTFGDRLRRARSVESAVRRRAIEKRHARDPALPGGDRARGRDAAETFEVEVGSAPGADNRHAGRAPSAGDRRQKELVRSCPESLACRALARRRRRSPGRGPESPAGGSRLRACGTISRSVSTSAGASDRSETVLLSVDRIIDRL